MNAQLSLSNYLYLPALIPQDTAHSLATEFIQYCASNNIQGDIQAPNSSSAYNYVGFAELLCELTPVISKVVGEKVLPTYSYARVYRKGDDLKIHKDREACEISVTLTLSQSAVWPIYIKTPNGDTSTVLMSDGDAMLYLGCEAEHWREELRENTHVQVFLHYVLSRGKRSDFAFDAKNPSRNIRSTQVYSPPEKETASSLISSFILEISNIVPESLFSDIQQEYFSEDGWKDSAVGPDANVDKSIRGADIKLLSTGDQLTDNQKRIDQELFACVSKAITEYRSKFPRCVISQDSGYELLRYREGYGYSEHVDSFFTFPREISCSIALNDDYEGGEFAFFNQEIVVKQKRLSALLFPSNFMYPHQINPVTKGTRYSIITWFR